MKIAPNVHKVVFGEPHNDVYMITGERAAFFDSGLDDDEQINALLELWAKLGRPSVAAIIVSHWHTDHCGGASKLSRATGGAIYSSEVEKPIIEQIALRTHVSHTVADGETLELGGATLEFVHTPGHTYGSMSVYYREQAVLFTGDTVRTSAPFSMSPKHGEMADHLESLTKLLKYNIRLIAPGHGPEVHDPGPFLENELATLSVRD